MRTAVIAACVLMLAAPVAAQGVVNPTRVQWDHADYATAQQYEGGYFAVPVAGGTCDWTGTAAGEPTMRDNLGKPASADGTGIASALLARPRGCYVYRVRALDVSGLWSEWSVASGPFGLLPAAPGNVTVSR